jgi:hypothetical protein
LISDVVLRSRSYLIKRKCQSTEDGDFK